MKFVLTIMVIIAMIYGMVTLSTFIMAETEHETFSHVNAWENSDFMGMFDSEESKDIATMALVNEPFFIPFGEAYSGTLEQLTAAQKRLDSVREWSNAYTTGEIKREYTSNLNFFQMQMDSARYHVLHPTVSDMQAYEKEQSAKKLKVEEYKRTHLVPVPPKG